MKLAKEIKGDSVTDLRNVAHRVAERFSDGQPYRLLWDEIVVEWNGKFQTTVTVTVPELTSEDEGPRS